MIPAKGNAQCFKLWGLTCKYRTAGPSVSYDVINIRHVCITGVKAGARCCKVLGLTCDYKTAGPSFPFDGAMAEARCDAGDMAVGEFVTRLIHSSK